jgi:hypothetical protein
MLTVNVAHSPLSDLKKAVTKSNAGGGCVEPAAVEVVVGAGATVQRTIRAINLCRLAILVRHGEMVTIDIGEAPCPNLNKIVTPLDEVVAGQLRVGTRRASPVAIALTSKAAGAVNALGTIFAWVGSAVVDVRLAAITRESRGALARIVVDFVCADGLVLARVSGAVVDVGFTIFA